MWGHALAAVLAVWLGACSGKSAAPEAAKPTNPAGSGWWRDSVFYEVFVRSFADSDGDGIGDLTGLVAHLDDLNDADPVTTTDLGVNALWLMPIFPAASYHGYDVTDYRSVDPAYGTLHDVDVLVSAAHARGVKVVLDLVLNHTSDQHPWFQDSRSSPSAARRGWYLWRGSDPGWTQPGTSTAVWHPYGGAYYYGYFWGGMPDLNLGNAAVEAELLGVMRFWLARGIDGFRLDAVRHYFESVAGTLADQPETHAFLRRMRAALQADHPEVLLVAETWTDAGTAATYWGDGDEAQLGFFFPTSDALKNAAFFGEASYLTAAMTQAEAVLAGKDLGYQAPFLSNHDVGRALRALGGNAARVRVAAAALLALPGTPFLYYGDELGMQGGVSDPEKRTPYRWTATGPGYGFTSAPTTWFSATYGPTSEAAGVDVATQRPDGGSLWNLHRRLVALRLSQPALRTGAPSRPAVTGGGAGTFALLRSADAGRVLFVVNFAGASTGPFTVAVPGTPAVLDAEGLVSAPYAASGAVAFPGLGARSFAFLSLQ